MKKLTEKQMEIVEMMVNGATNKDIETNLSISRIRVHQQKTEIRRRMEFEYGEDVAGALRRYVEWLYNSGEV